MYRRNPRNNKISQIVLYTSFAVYIVIFINIVFFRTVSFGGLLSGEINTVRSINIIPFISKYQLLQRGGMSQFLQSIAGNMAVFIPFGIFIKVILPKRHTVHNIAILSGISLAIEIIQFIFGLGTFDINDILLNTLGGIIGLTIGAVLIASFRDPVKMKSAAAGLMTTGLIFSIAAVFILDKEALPFVSHASALMYENIEVLGDESPETADVYGDLIRVTPDVLDIILSHSKPDENNNKSTKSSHISINFDEMTKVIFSETESKKVLLQPVKIKTTYREGTINELLELIPQSNGEQTTYIRVWSSDEGIDAPAKMIEIMSQTLDA